MVRGYTFLSRQYAPGDAIHIVGVSRGAYTARALAGMICAVGLLDTTRDEPADKFSADVLGYGAWRKARGGVSGGGGPIAHRRTESLAGSAWSPPQVVGRDR